MIVKFISSLYSEEFLNGKIRCGSARDFVENYADGNFLRQDSMEHATSLERSSKIGWLSNDEVVKPSAKISLVAERSCLFDHFYMFCAMSLDSALTPSDAKRASTEFSQFGDRAIIVKNSEEFERRVTFFARKNGWARHQGKKLCDLVKYRDMMNFPGAVGPFQKHSRFAYQREWRAAFIKLTPSGETLPKAVFLELGNIRRICQQFETDDFIRRVNEGASFA